MAEFYIASINDQETVPLSLRELAALAQRGEIVSQTPVRGVDDSTWSTWDEIDQPIKPAPRAVTTETLRAEIRNATAYPALRAFIMVFSVLCPIAAVILAVLALSFPLELMIYALASSACLSVLVFLILLNVMLDIADCALIFSGK